MSIFLVCKKQRGEGCDYTIGCGMRFDWMEADSLETMVELLIWPNGREERATVEGEYPLDTIMVIPAEHVTRIDVDATRELVRAMRVEEFGREKEATEIAALRALAAKYPHVL